MKIAIVTDSNSGLTQREAENSGVYLVPMPVLIDGEQYFEDITLTQSEFYKKLNSGAQVSTSQPSAFVVSELWQKLLSEYDEIIHIPMSSGLSDTCSALKKVAETDFNGKVHVIDNQRISVPQKVSVEDAVNMVNDGKDPKEICDYLMETKLDSSIYITVDNLKYLKKGGRITSAVALIGTLLKIKPVLQIQGFKLDQYAKVRKLADAKATMINAIEDDLNTRFAKLRKLGKIVLAVAYTECKEEADAFKSELERKFPDLKVEHVDPLPLSIACHTGPGALGCACIIKY